LFTAPEEAVELGIVDQILTRRDKGEAKPESTGVEASKL
jgi:ATP-dependent protease ClpP protease subunit